MVEAITQIVHTTTQYILVCAQSNSACDEIAIRLLQSLAKDQVLRIYAKGYDQESLDKRLAPISNLRGDSGFQIPSIEYMEQFRVVICTLGTSGCISRARKERTFDAKHFGFIFIDEAACIPEIVTLIPIAGVCTSRAKVHSKIILAGDPKQLDAVAHSKYSTKMGYKKSFMEFLFVLPCFQHDPNRMVQLKQNYRSHPAIIHLANHLFYDYALKASAPPGHLK